jgi:transcriptional regulator with GAF, ATPase, and Fis domain
MPDYTDDRPTDLLPEPPAPFVVTRREAALSWTGRDGARTFLVQRPTLLGSSPEADVTIDDPAVSRVHCQLVPREDGIWLVDLNSTNGCFIGVLRVKEARVPDGATIQLGATRLTLAHEHEPRPVELWPTDRFGDLLGRSAAMRELFALLARVAQSDIAVLVQGETGTGKEVLASSLHRASPRADHPFVVVDCGAMPENLIEDELFGHVRGAFTGATEGRAGAIESADGGTVLLDEIGELPLSLQPRLLRALEAGRIRRLGDQRERPVNVRFISATHRDLLRMVSEGTFREDLYFRVAALPLKLPALRERAEDVPLLVEHFLPPGVTLPEETVAELSTRPWLGNVRELRNTIERVLTLGPDALDQEEPAALADLQQGLPPVDLDVPFKQIRQAWTDHLERTYIEGMLRRHGRSLARISQASGVDRSYVHRLMRKHDL